MRGKWIKLCIIMFCFTLCYGCSKKEERETLAEVQTIEEDSEEPQKEQKEKQNEEGGAEGGKICVYVCGQVVEPGVYELKNTSRLYEAVQAAGGMTETAADTYLNQAESLKDGQKIYVPSREEVQASAVPLPEGEQEDARVDLNKASKEELMTLNGIGESRADAIIEYRKKQGGFRSAEELKEVEGIKDGIFDKIKDQIKVS